MKPIAPPAMTQWKLPLIDLPSLALPEQRELAGALKEMLIQAARHDQRRTSCPPQEDLHVRTADD